MSDVKQSEGKSSLQYKGRPGSLDLQSQEYSIYPFDVFEMDDANKVDEPTLRLKAPWKFYITNAGYIGFESLSGDSDPTSPEDGDRRVYIDGDEIKFEEYTNEDWSSTNSIRIGGSDDNGVFRAFMNCRGIANPLADDVSQEFIPSPNFRVVDCEDATFPDQNGALPSSTTGASRSNTWSKFGTYSLGASSVIGTLKYDDEMSLENSLGACCWCKFTALADEANIFTFIYRVAASNEFRFGVEMDGYTVADEVSIRLRFTEIVTTTLQNETLTVTVPDSSFINQEVFIGIAYDIDNNEIALIVNDEVSTATVSALTLTGASTTNTIDITAFNNGTDAVSYIDDISFSSDGSANTDLFLQHYNHAQPWNADHSAKDLVLLAADGGEVVVNKQLKIDGASRVLAESTIGPSIATDTWTTFVYDTEIDDNLSEYNSSTGVFTPLKSGTYLINASIRYASATFTAGNRLYLRYVLNGTSGASLDMHEPEGTGTWYIQLRGTMMVNLTAGDEVSFKVYQSAGSSRTVTSTGNYNQLGIHRLS